MLNEHAALLFSESVISQPLLIALCLELRKMLILVYKRYILY